MTRLTACPDPETVAERASAHILRQLAHAGSERGSAHLALSGGTTPGRTYELLAAGAGGLSRVHVWFADERCVPAQDEQSNFRLVERTLLAPAGVPEQRVHRMEGELGPHEGARRYAAELEGALAGGESQAGGEGRRAPVLDLVVLGIGPDGHVASLFPGAESLRAGEQAACLGVSDSPKPPPERITLSLAVLRAARECVLLATGAAKADAVAAMLGEPTPHVPASLLRRERLTVFADDAAAPAAQR